MDYTVEAGVCEQCGTALRPMAHFCPACGNEIQQNQASRDEVAQNAVSPNTSSLLPYGIASLLLAVVCGTAAWFWHTSSANRRQTPSLTSTSLQPSSPAPTPVAAVNRCDLNSQEQRVSLWNNYSLRLSPNPQQSGCEADLVDANGKHVWNKTSAAFEIMPVTGQDINRDGIPELVLEAFSGGAHCCWTYFIFTMDDGSEMVSLDNETGVSFERDPQGRYYVHTADGAFDYFDELPHSLSVFPDLFLRVDRSALVDESSLHGPAYQNRIDNARSRLTSESLAAFRASDGHDPNLADTKSAVLEIVLEYLYAGKAQQAWDELSAMWPSTDQDRIRGLIETTRSKGILSRLAKSESAAGSTAQLDHTQGVEGIRSLLTEWVNSFQQKDASKQAECYAPSVETYYRKHDVSRSFVLDNKSRAFSLISEIGRFEVSNVSVTFESSDTAVVMLDKSWDTTLVSGKRYAGSELERLKVAVIDGRWRIRSEEEVKIYNVTR